jgi:hypothetical protein
MKRRKLTRKKHRRGGSKCHAKCKQTCPKTCRKLCHAASMDDEYNKEELAKLLVVKEDLKRQIMDLNKKQIDDVLKKETYNDKEKEAIRKLLESKDTDDVVKRIFLDKTKNSRFPVLRGGFSWMKYNRKYSECEEDCSKRCSESCDFLCKESVLKKGSKYKKEFELVSSEINSLRSVLAHIGS